MENEEQQSKEESMELELYSELHINKIKEHILNIERSYLVPFSIIGRLLKFQEENEATQDEPFSMNLTGEAKLKSKIYSLDTFLKQIKNPILNYIEKKEYNDKELEQILKNINDFLFRINFQFNSYLQKVEEEIIFNRGNSKNKKASNKNEENINKIKYDSIQYSNIIFSFTNFKIMITDISSNITLLSLLFQIQNMNSNLRNKINKKIDNHDKKIQDHEKAVKEQEKNMMAIMGIFISIFSLIQVNLSFFSHFEGKKLQSWIILIIVINITLIIGIKVIFNLIHQKDNSQENIISLINKKLYEKFSSWLTKKSKEENTKNINENNSQNNNLNTEQDKDTNNTDQ